MFAAKIGLPAIITAAWIVSSVAGQSPEARYRDQSLSNKRVAMVLQEQIVKAARAEVDDALVAMKRARVTLAELRSQYQRHPEILNLLRVNYQVDVFNARATEHRVLADKYSRAVDELDRRAKDYQAYKQGVKPSAESKSDLSEFIRSAKAKSQSARSPNPSP